MKQLSALLMLFMIVIGIQGCSKQNEQQVKQQLIEQTPEDFKPAFTRERVIELNTIVSHQLQVINQYDDLKITNEISAELLNLEKQSKLNLSHMLSAEQRLIASGEHYNKATFAGMKSFVEDVQHEISANVVMMKKNKAMKKVIMEKHLN